VAQITLKEEGKEDPFLHFAVQGDGHQTLTADAQEWIHVHANGSVRIGELAWDQMFEDVLVCGKLTDGKDICLPVKLEGTLRQVIHFASILVSDLIINLQPAQEGDSSRDFTSIERSLTEGQARRQMWGSRV
jgi:hypothetical protein